MSSIEDAINAAKAAAAAAPSEANANLGGDQVANYQSPGLPAQRGPALGVDDMLGGSINVDAWLKVNEYGLQIGADTTLFESVDAILDLSEIAYCYSVRYGNPATYEKTYDRVSNARGGGSWFDTLAKAQRIDPKAGEFRSADIPFTVVGDYKNKKGDLLIEDGKTLGHSISMTGWKSFQKFIRDISGKGIDIRNAKVALKIGYNVEKNTKGTWGTLLFSDVAVVV
ncbi:hypothetical protein [Mesorhizobium sp. STM 4661]|uniref:hypothetical protein n=1 Tax=Mesorhizobium sp. STM 4661 TaxID=1297570 RepID=UPI0002BEC6D2|nr:hypothetical protein [Mesorhizobium sp. STM 4661]CCV12886.1 hypothetical protein MESS4_510053 [Mesorhizobium sp. STM 4661]